MAIPVLARLIKGFVGDEGVVAGDDVSVTATNFAGNLHTTDINVQLLAVAIDALSVNTGGTPPNISALEAKVDSLFPLTPDVNILTAWADIYVPERTTETVTTLRGYTLIADYRSNTDRYESSGVTYGTGTNVITYTGLSDNLFRAFGFKVTGPENKVLMSIGTGASAIPFVDITSSGQLRFNDYTPATTAAQSVSNRVTFLTRTAGTEEVTTTPGSVSTFTVPDFPAGATDLNRTIEFEVEIWLNGSDSRAGREFVLNTVPNTAVAQARQTGNISVYLGPLYGNRTVTVTIGYEFRVSAGDLLLDLTLVNAPSDVTVSFASVNKIESYTAQTTVARVDNFIAASGFTFTGEQEFLITFHPYLTQHTTNVVPAAVAADGTITEINDVFIKIPTPIWSSVTVPDDIEFRTFLGPTFLRHDDLRDFLRDRATKWAYATARLESVSVHALSEAIDLATGSTLNGVALVRPENVVYQATGTGTAAGQLVSNVSLPANYADWRYVHVTEYDGASDQWRHAEFPTQILSSGNVQSTDNIRLQGNTLLTWTAGTRTLTMSPAAQEIYRVSLKD